MKVSCVERELRMFSGICCRAAWEEVGLVTEKKGRPDRLYVSTMTVFTDNERVSNLMWPSNRKGLLSA